MSGPNHPYPALQLEALALAGRRPFARRIGHLLLVLLVAAPFVLAFAPWQQNLRGEGRVIEYDPVHRPMPLQARTDGVILKWHVREGQQVQAGDPIVDLADNDPRILERLQEQLEAAARKRDAARRKRDTYDARIGESERAREAAMQMADDEIVAAQQAVEVARQALRAAEENAKFRRVNLQMWSGLVEDRIGAGIELENARQQLAVAEAELVARQAAVTAAEATERARRSARLRVERDEQAKVQSAKADRDAAEGEVAEAEGAILRLQRDLERQKQQQLTAPIDGFVQNLLANGQGGGFVKQGTPLAMLVPATRQLAVELWIDGNDITFIDAGRHVRLQFEGWPAIQWVGWPSAAIGTFGGRVAFVDRFDDGRGFYRVMVLPDERPFREPEGPVVDWLRRVLTFEKVSMAENPHQWPGDPYLRQGVRTKGWIVLDRVSLGFEIWRQLNGFPPTVRRPATSLADPGGADGKGAGEGK
ncbi:MAG: HlyD family efflux transporter periplasmic adaptor subunit [Planctomycetes bacterium]|nr:HlyD family efflux transporter periplasmic adaptor subunit [Planctomycetota bacterium]